ncbi:guanylate kinase [Parvularcula flava]|uniref:Guanylate kinase n=1 Tax=Aquisalinus luteolus TaxID=1566827 RepID=A0A8J3A174_9PROT|nr:guanylate kinase [Aquisalinus luteolus]NHK27411.1 guanylate kinase [Aquisalinus luteolus]GGH95360.1 guanylate kinase [Aquisalinus luteolus]
MKSPAVNRIPRRGLMFVVSSPSGAGKTTLCNRLLQADPDLSLSVSATTRKPRPGETDGVDYHFIDEDKFLSMRKDGAFLESAKVFDNYYGTPKAQVEEALSSGKDVLFDIDWQGAQQLGEIARDDLVKVFILPPSRDELERRLHKRAQDSAEVVAARMAKADSEISHWAEYDYVVLNYELDESEALLQSILVAERLKRTRQIGLGAKVKAIIEGED